MLHDRQMNEEHLVRLATEKKRFWQSNFCAQIFQKFYNRAPKIPVFGVRVWEMTRTRICKRK